jgi:hypothetical protein
LLGFLSEVSATFARETAQDIFRAVLKDFIPCITLAARDEKRIRIGSSGYIHPATLDPDDIIRLVQQCITLDLGLEVHRLSDRLQKLAATEEPATIVMKMFFIPFTGKLYKMAAERSTTPVAPEKQDRVSMFTAEIFDLYANRCVGPKPMPLVRSMAQCCQRNTRPPSCRVFGREGQCMHECKVGKRGDNRIDSDDNICNLGSIFSRLKDGDRLCMNVAFRHWSPSCSVLQV